MRNRDLKRLPTIRALLPLCVIGLSAPPFPVHAQTLPSCTLVDVTDALSQDLTCSLSNAVIFGSSAADFVTNSCAALAPSATPGSQVDKASQAKCVTCATKAWKAFDAATKAGLIKPDGKKLGVGAIQKLCKVGQSSDDSPSSPQNSDSLNGLFDQLKLCLPAAGTTPTSADIDSCKSCAKTTLDTALSQNLISQAKHDVLVASSANVCAGQKPSGDDGDNDKKPGNKPTPPPQPSVPAGGPPVATPTFPPNAGSPNSFDKLFAGFRACFKQFEHQPDACLSCLTAIDTSGLNPTLVQQAMIPAQQKCLGTFVPREPSPTPTPGSGGSGDSH